MTLQHYWFNVWFNTLDAYLNMQFWDRGQSWFTLLDLEHKFDCIFLFINVFEIWATCVIKSWRFMLSFERYQFFRRLTFTIVSLRSWSSVRKPIFALLSIFLAIFSLIHHNVISSGINGRFTGLILNEFSAFSIWGDVILRDQSQITISDTKMHLMLV